MTTHVAHPKPSEREAFLVDGCPRCAEYVEDQGVSFDEDRFRAFWAKMVEVEYESVGAYVSDLDRQLGRKLYHLSLALERAFGISARGLVEVGRARGRIQEALAAQAADAA